MNATGADWYPSRHACFSVSRTHPNLNARDALLSSSTKALLRSAAGLPALNAAVTFLNVNLIEVEAAAPSLPTFFVSEIKQEYPLNLSISLSGGKEIN